MKKIIRLLLVLGLTYSAYTSATSYAALNSNDNTTPKAPIQHIEPPNWWVGMKDPELQIMLHGERIAENQIQIKHPGVRVIGIEKTENPNFVFIKLKISANALVGSMKISLIDKNQQKSLLHYRLEAREPNSATRASFSSRDAIYLLMPDRFANGDPHNDKMAGMHQAADRQQATARHGGDIAGMRQQLDYIKDMGFTMIWPTPLLENNEPAYSYHGYALTDYYKIDARFGTNQEYRDYVRAAQRRGLGVIQDVVLNHIGTGHWWMKDMPAKDWLNLPMERSLTNNQHSTVQDIHVAPEERRQFLEGWFDGHMADLNQRNPLLARYLIQNSIWWIEYASLAGLREDTFSYADTPFLAQWCRAVLREYPNLNIVGEEMDERPHMVAYWQKGARNRDGYDSSLPSVMDFPVVDALPSVLNDAESYNTGWIKLYETIAADYLYPNPMNLLVFPDNHDRPRLFARLHHNLNLFKTALLFNATVRGIPQFFYGTEVLISSPIERNDGLLRADMPGGWADDTVNAFTGKGLTTEQKEIQNYLRNLLQWRKQSSAIHHGKMLHYLPQNGQYVYFRYDANEVVMVILNKAVTETQLDLNRFRKMIKDSKSARNILTGESVSLEVPLRLAPQESSALTWRLK